MAQLKKTERRRLLVTGTVQGVGFRPFIYRLARRHALAGWVRNTAGGVEIEVEGAPDALRVFADGTRSEAPALARVENVVQTTVEPAGERGFSILESAAGGLFQAVIPADVATCGECFEEIREPGARRFGYPFTNCTNCGPRFTIVRRIPYERSNTTMSAFAMCTECSSDYADPQDRRFHAEPIACPACGPSVWLEIGGKRVAKRDALSAAGRLLADGGILAIKGLGGFHFACDARNERAVALLRERKGRVAKPFALMVSDVAEAERVCELADHERAALLSYERPIVLAKRRADSGITGSVAPGNRFLGVMLPYTPLHPLLLRHTPPALVMTSGNLSEEPIAFTNDFAKAKLADMADAFLLHDREIHVPCDDSVIRPVAPDLTVLIRRARGFVPNPIELPIDVPEILACGAEQKSTFCVAWDRVAILSQHIGDLDTVETLDYYRYAIEHFKALCRKDPKIVAHDLHPGYMSTRYARQLADVRLVGVQHHHAHIASCMAENGRAEKCIGVALDGTGYGADGTVWGGELLVADLAHYERVGHFAQVRLPGGEAALRDPRKTALAYLHSTFGEEFLPVADRLGLGLTPLETTILRCQLETGLNSPITSSAGRLFDAVSAALGVCLERTYEGQPAVELEMAADESEDGFYPASVRSEHGMLVMDMPAIFRAAVEERLGGVDNALIAARFHNSIARVVADACRSIRGQSGLGVVALSGGVMQNALVVTRLRDALVRDGFGVLVHRRVPPNDGGISLGQTVVAASAGKEQSSCASQFQ